MKISLTSYTNTRNWNAPVMSQEILEFSAELEPDDSAHEPRADENLPNPERIRDDMRTLFEAYSNSQDQGINQAQESEEVKAAAKNILQLISEIIPFVLKHKQHPHKIIQEGPAGSQRLLLNLKNSQDHGKTLDIKFWLENSTTDKPRITEISLSNNFSNKDQPFCFHSKIPDGPNWSFSVVKTDTDQFHETKI